MDARYWDPGVDLLCTRHASSGHVVYFVESFLSLDTVMNSPAQMKNVGRRALLTSLAISPLVGVHSASSRPRARERLRLAAIGVGNRGANNIYPMETEQLVAIADVDATYLEAMKLRHPEARAMVDYRELLELPDLDGIIISTPDHHHALAAYHALERGLHVYCEKPLAHNILEVRTLRTLAQRRCADQACVAVMGNQHHDAPGYRAVSEIVSSGRIGEVREIHAWTSKPLWPQGHRRREPMEQPDRLDWNLWLGAAAETPFHRHCHPFHWRGWWDYGTGALGDMGPHLLDPVFRAFGLKLPSSVHWVAGEATDLSPPTSSKLRFDFRRPGGEKLTIHWYDGLYRPAPELANVRTLPGNGVLLVGEEARLFIPQLGKPPLIIRDSGNEPVRVSTEKEPSHQEKFIAACHDRGPVVSPFAYAADLTESCLWGNLAIRRRGEVSPTEAAAESEGGRAYRQGWKVPSPP